MAPISSPLQAMLDGYMANLRNPNLAGERIISIGRAAGLALELKQEMLAQTLWLEAPAVAGMPSLAQFHAAYEANPDAFAEFTIGEGKAFTAPGTAFSNAVGAYARGLHYAAKTQQAADEDSPAYWAGDWGAKALTAAGFPEQAQRLQQAIVSGVKLEAAKAQTPNR